MPDQRNTPAFATGRTDAVFELEDYELLNPYYDVQLTSTGDYYNSSRILHLVLLLFNHEFPVYIIFIEMVMMDLLIAYAYLAHMTKENLYGRRMDVSSERG